VIVMESPMKDVKGKVAFITGGDSGIGLGITHALINAGMKVAITYRTKAHLDHAMEFLRGSAENLLPINLDVTDRTGMIAAAEQVVGYFGKVHVLINNAGVVEGIPLSNATFDDFDWCMNVNVNGVFNGIRAFLPHIRSHGEGGQVVATSSMLGGLIAGPFWGVYTASKFAVVGMMEGLRTELARTNIGVSVFCPAGVKTNIASSERNRPPDLGETGSPDSHTLRLIEKFDGEMLQVMSREDQGQPLMDPLEAGACVLRGIRHNDLYILSHPEYEQAIRDRCEALLASFRVDANVPSEARLAMARISRNEIYSHECNRRAAERKSTRT
jgi:NAD(P)-dependent dehydrogenase (short-subunit alcohol dehydrogenase family)